jgi:hypothetical protein
MVILVVEDPFILSILVGSHVDEVNLTPIVDVEVGVDIDALVVG